MTKRAPSASDPDPLVELYARPGFLIRRAHQIAVGLFLEEASAQAITTTQYGAMVVLNTYDSLDQISLSKRLGIDRSTAALVVGKLEAAGHVVREVDEADLRRNVIRLTPKGAHVLFRLREPAERARQRLLAALPEPEAQRFVVLLDKFVSAFNSEARAPIGPLNAPGRRLDRNGA